MTQYGLKLSQRGTAAEQRSVWRIADDAFDSCWVMDHFLTLGDDGRGDIFEAWTQLAAMAEVTNRVRIGCMVTGNTYRHPGVLAKMAATVDHFSDGRLEFGFGAGWAEPEHTMLGLEYGTVGERADRLDEACEVITALWTQATTTFHGKHYTLTDAVSYPKPVQRPYPPMRIGGMGRKRTLRTAARFADVWDVGFAEPDDVAELHDVLRGHCDSIGRDSAEIRLSKQVPWVDDPDAMTRTVERFVELGVSEIVFIVAGDAPTAAAEQAAGLVPRLRSRG